MVMTFVATAGVVVSGVVSPFFVGIGINDLSYHMQNSDIGFGIGS